MSPFHRAVKSFPGLLMERFAEAARRCGSLLLPALLLLALAACSTRFFYDRVDSFIVWQVNGYVGLDKGQKTELKRRVSQHLNEIRLEELPQAAQLLQAIAADINSAAVTPQMVDARFQQMLGETEKVMTGIVPIAEWLLLTLSEEQIRELEANLAELNEEMYEEYSGSTAEERRERRNKSATRAIQRFTGRLDDTQKELVTGALERMTDSSEQWISYQREWQRRFIKLLSNPPASEQFRQDLTVLLVYPRSLHSPEYTAAVEANRAILNVMLAELLNGLSERQRKRMVETVEGYADTLNQLAANPAA